VSSSERTCRRARVAKISGAGVAEAPAERLRHTGPPRVHGRELHGWCPEEVLFDQILDRRASSSIGRAADF